MVFQGCRFGPESSHQTLVENQYLDPAEGTICGGWFPNMYRGQICNLVFVFWMTERFSTYPLRCVFRRGFRLVCFGGANPMTSQPSEWISNPKHPKSSSHTWWEGVSFSLEPLKTETQEMFRDSNTSSKGVWMHRVMNHCKQNFSWSDQHSNKNPVICARA